MKLTKHSIKAIQLPAGKSDLIVWDDAVPGFGIRIRAGGSRGYIVQYKLGTQNRRMSLGATLSVEQAREEAKTILAKVRLGGDPQAAKVTARVTAADTFKAIAETYLKTQVGKLRPASLYATELYLMRHAKQLHSLNVDAVTRRDIAGALSSIAETSGAISADRARSALSAMYGWAIGAGLVEIANPVTGTNTFAGNVSRDRVLDKSEIAAIWSALDRLPAAPASVEYATIVRLLFLTACRSNEIGGLRWSEVRLEDRLIAFPAERCKNGLAFDMPLSDMAMGLLPAPRDGRDLVFGQHHGAFQSWSRLKSELDAQLGAIAPWQVRDIRRTVATGMANIGVLPHVIEACLNHTSGHKSGVAGVYNRASYAKEKREAVNVWANHVRVLLAQASGANISRLHAPAIV